MQKPLHTRRTRGKGQEPARAGGKKMGRGMGRGGGWWRAAGPDELQPVSATVVVATVQMEQCEQKGTRKVGIVTAGKGERRGGNTRREQARQAQGGGTCFFRFASAPSLVSYLCCWPVRQGREGEVGSGRAKQIHVGNTWARRVRACSITTFLQTTLYVTW